MTPPAATAAHQQQPGERAPAYAGARAAPGRPRRRHGVVGQRHRSRGSGFWEQCRHRRVESAADWGPSTAAAELFVELGGGAAGWRGWRATMPVAMGPEIHIQGAEYPACWRRWAGICPPPRRSPVGKLGRGCCALWLLEGDHRVSSSPGPAVHGACMVYAWHCRPLQDDDLAFRTGDVRPHRSRRIKSRCCRR